jgi:hypothetical protein
MALKADQLFKQAENAEEAGRCVQASVLYQNAAKEYFELALSDQVDQKEAESLHEKARMSATRAKALQTPPETASVVDEDYMPVSGEDNYSVATPVVQDDFDRSATRESCFSDKDLYQGALCAGGGMGATAGCLIGCPILGGAAGAYYAYTLRDKEPERYQKLGEMGAKFMLKTKKINEEHRVLERSKNAAVSASIAVKDKAYQYLYPKTATQQNTHAKLLDSEDPEEKDSHYQPPAQE